MFFSKLACYVALVIFPQIVHSFDYYRFYSSSEDTSSEYTSSDILDDARLDTLFLLPEKLSDEMLVSKINNVLIPLFAYATETTISIKCPHISSDIRNFSLIRKYGYPCEIHRVYTEDKYILEMHRIPNNSPLAPVVLLQHGLLSSSAEWVLMTPGRGLAYILADAGYDVWMGNARGNTYSHRHVSLKPTSSAYWKFSWHEIGYYDLPAMIDYVLKDTGASRIQYIGFSQGTTVFWVLMSTRPEYNEKIVAMQALAPVGYVGNIKSPLIKAIAPFTNSLELIFKILGTNEILPNGKLNELAGQKLCIEEAITQSLCTNLLFLMCGFNSEQLNTTMLPVVLGHTPAGASTRQLIHFGQLYKSGKFAQFDYGWIANKRIYGSFKPPAYDLQKIKTPVFLHYADNDWISTPTDVKKLALEIPTAIGLYRVPLAKFNHLDFVFAINATELIYNRLLNIMAQFKDEP